MGICLRLILMQKGAGFTMTSAARKRRRLCILLFGVDFLRPVLCDPFQGLGLSVGGWLLCDQFDLL